MKPVSDGFDFEEVLFILQLIRNWL